jgi:hypothetical protein
MKHRILETAIAWLVIMSFPSVAHALAIDGFTSDWTAIQYAGLDPDPNNDQQTGQREADIVGTTLVPAIYTQFDDNGTVGNNADDTIAFRFRMSTEQNPSGYSHVMLIGIDASPFDANERIDLYMILSNSGGSNSVQLYDPGAQANISPSTTSTTAIAGTEVVHTALNYDWGAVDRTPVTGNCDGDCTLEADDDVDLDNNGTDYFLSFSYSFQAILDELANNGVLGLDENSAFSYVFGSSTQVNAFNQDLGGVDDTTLDGNLTWSTLGATSTIYSASGAPIPEPGTALLVALGFVVLSHHARRHRKRLVQPR